ncbi:catalase-like domain-containing protein [Lipomyces kononenkoae]|uniref:Catalase-like domain-containing protein n=1 Tax=Lipomyces kononenkoae TaxID=34357 RepID=A0ACC3T2B8_LIPKO
MPLSDDPQVVQTSSNLVATLKAAFGTPKGFRPAHARGILLTGSFVPSTTAGILSTAKHFHDPATSVTVRFSSSTGIPEIPDTDPNANPRGFAIRFHLGNDESGKRVHTDIVTHSTPFFPTKTGEEFLQFVQALGTSGPDAPHPTPLEQFLASHPETLSFVQESKPSPLSFATEAYFGVNAFKLVDSTGKATFIRYRVVPVQGVHTLDEAALKSKDPNYLYEEIAKRVQEEAVGFKLFAQVAEDGDITDDATIHWPEGRQLVELGELTLTNVVPQSQSANEQKHIIFDPIPRIKGVEPSDDPLLDVRASVYLISGRERRAA